MTVRARKTPIRVAVLSNLYPNTIQPRHGIFVEERLRCLLATGRVEARVVAPVPWFFSTRPVFGQYARFAAVPQREIRYGVSIDHPRYAVIPRIGMPLSPTTMAAAVARTLHKWRAEGFDFDLIDAHYFYPDGVAAARLSRRMQRPFVITARGTDINTIATFRLPRRQIRAAADKASALIAVSDSLRDRLVALGVAPEKVTTLRNGVDRGRFAPVDRARARAQLDVSGPVWLAVGHLIERKGTRFAIEALPHCPDVTLLIVGDGPEEATLRALARRLGVMARVRFIGQVEHDDLPSYYSACDALVLPTRAEGMPNVVLEAIACGAAVVATAVDGIPEIVTGLPAGVLMRDRTAAALASAWETVRQAGLGADQRRARRDFSRAFSWERTSAGQIELFERALEGPAQAGGEGCPRSVSSTAS